MERRVLVALLLVALVVSSSVAAIVLFYKPGPADNRTARVWVDLRTLSDGVFRERDRWGTVETFSDAPLGTLNSYRQVALVQNQATESVVLDGAVWCMIKGNASNAVLLRYSPRIDGPSWNMSFECYAPQGTDFFDPAYGVQRIGLTATLIDTQGKELASVDLSYGNPSNRNVTVTDVNGGKVHILSDSLLPAYQYRNAMEGSAPARYIISFRHVEGERSCLVTVLHTSGVKVGQTSIPIPSNWSQASQLVLSTTSSITYRYGADPNLPNVPLVYVGAWMVDNLACRGATARYPLAGPVYEYTAEGTAAPASNSTWSSGHDGANVTIDGRPAVLNSATGRYEVDLPLNVQWSRKVSYTVIVDGVMLNDRMYLTMSSAVPDVSVSQWWNGWDWVSVFGEDDCSAASDVVNKYQGFDHPLTAYVMASGYSNQPSNVEIALHAPHDWEYGNRKFWSEASSQAQEGMNMLRSSYNYASRWDDPASGGKGDTYISMAYPGNKASYELLYALNAAGIKIDGRASENGAAGNRTQLGSYYYPGGYLDTGSGWYPYTPTDLMDASRQLSWDYARGWNATFSLVDKVANGHGVLRVYGHPGRAIQDADVLHWIDGPKTNYSLENWKATDGEVASYLYGRWSTDIKLDPRPVSSSSLSYNIRVKDPTAAGYWKVPITVAVDLHGRAVKDVIVHDGWNTMRLSDGTLKDLHSSRVMDRGYDVRNDTLYVSAFWSEGSSLTIEFDDHAPTMSSSTQLGSFLVMRDAELAAA
ncbi:MAG: hypothetical protein ACM3L5_00965 [Candidatus Saccharibacteria bacterium]